MNSLVLRKTALGRDVSAKIAVTPALGRILPVQRPARLRRRGPVLWAALALFVLAADFLLASLAWLAVDFVMR
ncbi:hypothetical protein FXB40_00650 [Bradyrhizobium rifense]|uniref:Uncharacterized protein n=1 Tax=Bradyrhizobium rifense TaxID=515499 RepID=A0A5D3KQE4_9BRAD|nr:hypothetical protein FXB40_00650 [Bradyrhizobium rifense]